MPLNAINPANGQLLAEYEPMTIPEMAEAIKASHAAFRQWRRVSFVERAAAFTRMASFLRAQQNELGLLMTREMGKPVKQSRAEVEKCAWVCEYFAENAARFLADEPVEAAASESFITFQPIGVVLAIMPWNFPFWQVFRAAAPALMAGNGMVLKHASNVPGCALAIERLFAEAGFPENLFRTLLVGSNLAPVAIAHDLVRAVTLTGSTEAGERVAALAGSQIKKTVLELGGSDPYLVLADADLDHAAATLAAGKMINGGQSCIAVKRIIVVEAVREAFEAKFVAAMRGYPIGDPEDENCLLGAMARVDLRDELHGQVEHTIGEGASCLLGGNIPKKSGAWYPATVLSGVKPGMLAAEKELFGPVAVLMSAADEDEAVHLANATEFGLGGGIFSRDVKRAKELARSELQTGSVAVNDFVKSDPRLPFGGVGKSGYGRELAAIGIKEFVNIKTVTVK